MKRPSVPSHLSVTGRGAWLMALMLLGACTAPEAAPEAAAQVAQGVEADGSADLAAQTPVALALEVDDGTGIPLKLKSGQAYYINQLDLRASLTATKDEGLEGMRKTGDFASLPWTGLKFVEQEPLLSANPDGTYTRRRFYRDAQWMDMSSLFTVQPQDSRGRATGKTLILRIGRDDQLRDNDDFFIRRLRGIQWTYDCKSLTSCTGAKSFLEEALVEVRNARSGAESFTLSPDTTQLKVGWSLRSGADYTIPVEQVKSPPYAYGISAELKALTPPRANGTYAAGSQVKFQVTLRDGAGKRLHPQGSLPTYNEVTFGQNETGLQYYRAFGFIEPTTTYYRRKHRERMMMTQIIGPAQRIQPIRSIVELEDFLGPDDVQTVGRPERDGVFSQFQTFPPSNDLFGGAYDPAHAGWAAPVSDAWTFSLPANAEAGTYLVTLKGRRVFMGQDIPYSTTVSIQVDSPKPTSPQLTTGPCNTCHSNGGELNKVLHANDNRAACNGCHAPLGFELEGPIYVRTHFLHSRSNRFEAPKQQCDKCHLTAESIQRTSKSACLSCHTSYPASHVAQFGPIESMYVGGGRESFQQCTGSCHKTHPGSGL